MKRILPSLIVFVCFAMVSHLLLLFSTPSLIMSMMAHRLSEAEISVHQFSLSPRVSPDYQPVVRPSPDLAYSICLFDTSTGPVHISGTPWTGYASLSVFDMNTNNVYVTSLDEALNYPHGVIVTGEAELPGSVAPDLPRLTLPSQKGLALIRRLAPSQALYDEVARISQGDVCELVSLAK